MLSRIAFKTVKNVNLHQQIWCPSLVGALRTSSSSSSCPAPSGTTRSAATSASGPSDEEFSYYAKSGTKFPWEGPERDVVNFPRPVQPDYPGKVRFLFVPEEWFQFFYKKTGVTGPYAFGFGMFTYLMSKELWVMDHEYFYVYAVAAIFYLANKKFGAKIAASLDKQVDDSEAELKALRSREVAALEEAMKEEEKLKWQAEGQKMLIEAKKENVAIQQEAAYRERAMQVYNEVRKRLEFHSQKQMMERRVSQKHMVNWVLSQVLKSITPEQEKDTLRKCLSDLQGLAARS